MKDVSDLISPRDIENEIIVWETLLNLNKIKKIR